MVFKAQVHATKVHGPFKVFKGDHSSEKPTYIVVLFTTAGLGFRVQGSRLFRFSRSISRNTSRGCQGQTRDAGKWLCQPKPPNPNPKPALPPKP